MQSLLKLIRQGLVTKYLDSLKLFIAYVIFFSFILIGKQNTIFYGCSQDRYLFLEV